MARIETDPNYTAPTFSRATEENDLFKKSDVQNLAAAVSSHDHTPGKGAQINGSTIGRPLDLPGSVRAGGQDTFIPGLGTEMGYVGPEDTGYVQAVWRQTGPTTTYKNLTLIGQTVKLRNGAGQEAYIDTAGNWIVPLAIGAKTSITLGSVPAGTATSLVHTGGNTVLRQEDQVLMQNHSGTVWSKLTAGEFVSGANKYGFGSGTANVTTDGVNLLLRGGGIYCQDAAGAQTNLFALSINVANATIPGTINCGYISAGGTVTANGIMSNGNIHVGYGGVGQLFFGAANQGTIYWDGTLLNFSPHVYTPAVYSNHIGNSNVGGAWYLQQGNQADRAHLVGALGIGTNDVQGRVLFVNGNAGGTSTWQQVSSLRFKSNVEVLAPSTAVQFVTDDTLRPLRYEHELRPDEGYEYGFAAEEFVTRVPESVKLDGEALPLAMEYSHLIPILWAALRNTIERVDALEAA